MASTTNGQRSRRFVAPQPRLTSQVASCFSSPSSLPSLHKPPHRPTDPPSPPLTNGPGRPGDPPGPVRIGDCSRPAPLPRYDHTRCSLDGLFFPAKANGCCRTTGVSSRLQDVERTKKKGEKKRKPHAALSLCHQILQSNESMASSSLGHHRLVRPTSESSPEFLSGLSSLLTRKPLHGPPSGTARGTALSRSFEADAVQCLGRHLTRSWPSPRRHIPNVAVDKTTSRHGKRRLQPLAIKSTVVSGVLPSRRSLVTDL